MVDQVDKDSLGVKITAVVLLIPVVLIFLLLIIVSGGYAASLTWNLFVPQYFGLPQLPLALAISLVALIRIFISTDIDYREDKTAKEKNLPIILGLINPWVAYLIVLIATNIYF